MHKTSVHLADGRELIYYDGSPTPHPETDPRPLPPHSPTSTLRRDPLLDQWTIVAGHRQERTHMPSAAECPLCPSVGGRYSEIPAPDYEVVVFENRFPALSGTGHQQSPALSGTGHQQSPALSGTGHQQSPALSGTGHQQSPALSGTGHAVEDTTLGDPGSLHLQRPGAGRCEVICFTSDHDSSFAALAPSRCRLVVDVWADRTLALSALPEVAQVFCFENRGAEIGVTEPHPHGQIYGYPFVTPRTSAMIATASRYGAECGRSLVDDVVDAERSGPRVVASTALWTAFVPFAARWPYEVHIYPNRRVPGIPSLSLEERDDFATLYLDVLQRFDRLFERPAPYVSAWHQAPASASDLLGLHLELFTSRRGPDKLKFLAGSESAMDVFVGDIVPEDAARRLREVG